MKKKESVEVCKKCVSKVLYKELKLRGEKKKPIVWEKKIKKKKKPPVVKRVQAR